MKKILVVDDETAILMALRRLLAGPEIEVHTAETMVDAERLLGENSYDAVIADLRLTGVIGEEGLHLIRYVRQRSPGTEVILITAYGTPQVRERALELGAAFYFEKPVPSATIREALGQLGFDYSEPGAGALA